MGEGMCECGWVRFPPFHRLESVETSEKKSELTIREFRELFNA